MTLVDLALLLVKRVTSSLRRRRAHRKRMNNGYEIYFDSDTLYVVSPEGKSRSMRLEEFFEKVRAPAVELSRVIPPKGVLQRVEGNAVIWIYQRDPQPYSFKWIAPDSTMPFGRGTKYREVTIALPYLVVFAVFAIVPPGRLTLTSSNEAFFRNAPIRSPDDELYFPALLNCSMFNSPQGRPLAWICTQYLDRSFDREEDLNRRMNGGFKALLSVLLEAGFNYSSEHHEGMSGFSASQKLDERISTVEKWQEASKQSPLFALEVPWLPTGFSVAGVTERIFKRLNATRPPLKTAADVARIVFNQNSKGAAASTAFPFELAL